MNTRVKAFIAREWGVPEAALAVELQPLGGGLESTVARARITRADAAFGSVPQQLIVKELQPGVDREADIYRVLWRHFTEPPAVRILGCDVGDHATYLYLEDAVPAAAWPWSKTAYAAAVCRALARLHDSADLPREKFSWGYASALTASAASTLDLASRARDETGQRHWRRLGDLRRVVTALPAIRARLLAGDTAIIHGDVHPGNVILRDGDPEPHVAFIDWARARIGSPMEDLASWLHSLGCWEPEARRRHDTLLRAYLDARRIRRELTDARLEYWLASVSNGLAGAIRYHLAVLCDPAATGSLRYHSWRALREWERVVRRAATLLSTTRDRCA